MNEIIKEFVGKYCLVTVMGEGVQGVVLSVQDNWLVLRQGTGISYKLSTQTVVNIDHISSIREMPAKKK